MKSLLKNGLNKVNPCGYPGGQEWLWWAHTLNGFLQQVDGETRSKTESMGRRPNLRDQELTKLL